MLLENNNDWKRFLAVNSHKKFIKIFKDIFLGVYLLKIDGGNITNVCLYYIIHCIGNIFFFNILNKSKISLLQMLRIGMFFSLIECAILLLLGSNITTYIIPFAIFTSFVNALYYYPQPLITSKLTTKDNKGKYCSWDRIINDMIGVIIPAVFGFIISVKSYNYVFIFLIIVTFIAFIYSFKIKEQNITCNRINLRKLFKSLKEHNSTKVIKLMTIRSFFRGLSSFGVMNTLMTILIYLTVKTESSLGNITGVITIFGIIVLYLVNNKLSRDKQRKLYIPMAIIQMLITCLLTISIIKLDNNITILGLNLGLLIVILYNLINGIINPIFEVANETIYYENINKNIIDDELASSYTYYFEVAINIPRILGYIILYLTSLIGFNIINICILIFILSFMYIAFAVTLKKLNEL